MEDCEVSVAVAMFFNKTKKKLCTKVLYRIPSFPGGDKSKAGEIVMQHTGNITPKTVGNSEKREEA